MTVASRAKRNRDDVLFDLNRSLWSLPAVRSHELPLELNLDDELRLTVRGHAPTRTIRDEILSVARSIDGIEEVQDQIVADPDLEIAIAESLASHPQTRQLVPGAINVFARFGEVVLVGEVRDVDPNRIVEVVSAVDGVRAVTNRLTTVE